MPKNSISTRGLLFKYRAIRHGPTGPINTFTRDIAKDGAIYFAAPSTLNDPHDCRICISLSGEEDSFARKLALASRLVDHYAESFAPGGPTFGQFGELTIQAINKTTELLDSQGYLLDEHVKRMVDKRFGVLSLSATATHPTLWSHYASSHTGVCFGFDKTAHPLLHARKVRYARTMPVLSLADLENTDDLVLTKGSSWRYEKEWRVVKRGQGIVRLDPSALRLVVFGCECPVEDAIEVRSWFPENRPAPRFARASKVPASFQLTLEAIT
jgi:hypothetical protein